MDKALSNLSFSFRYSKNPLVSKVRNVIRGLKSRRLNSALKNIYNDEGLRESLREGRVEKVVLYGHGYENLCLVPDPKNDVSWMGIGRMFYGNTTIYDYSDHPISEEGGKLVYEDLGEKRELARYLIKQDPWITVKQIKRRIKEARTPPN